MAHAEKNQTPDLTQGVLIASLGDHGTLVGHVGDEDVMVARVGQEFFAIGAYCTHYHGSLADGLVVGDSVRCPLHHACFSLRTGEALRAPALDAVSCWRVDLKGDRIFVSEKQTAAGRATPPSEARRAPASVIIIGGGAAGLAAADILRRERYDGPVTIVSADSAPPTDRPNLSKDYLAGEAQEDWIPLRSPEFYAENRITLMLDSRVSAIDVRAREIALASGQRMPFGALLIATGAQPVRLPIPGGDAKNVHYLRSFSDSQAIIAEARKDARAVVVGASFIGLEVAAALRTRGVHVDVVAPEKQPLSKVLGPELGRLIRGLHESHGVRFHLETTVARVDGRAVHLGGGDTLDADFVVIGAGVAPVVDLAKNAGLAVDRGVIVDEYLETGERGIFAAGDAARWLDRASGERLRVEHWVVALSQGQCAARNMLGRRRPFDAVPFFWSQHYDTTIRYIGHAETWDRVNVAGDLDALDCSVSFTLAGRLLAKATISRDRENLETELAMEQRARK